MNTYLHSFGLEQEPWASLQPGRHFAVKKKSVISMFTSEARVRGYLVARGDDNLTTETKGIVVLRR